MTGRLFLTALVAFTLHAETLTMESAVERALEQSPELAAERSARASAPYFKQAARALAPVEARMSFTNLSTDPELADVRNIAAVRWAPPRPHDISLKTKLAEVKGQQTEADIRIAELRLAAQVRQHYRRASVSGERTQLASQAAELRRRILDVTQQQVAVGLKESPEADLAALALAEAESAYLTRRSAEQIERTRLGRLVDPSANPTDFTLDRVPPPSLTVDRTALAQRALESRGEVRKAEAVCNASKSELAIARNQTYPWLSNIQVTRRIGASNGRAPWGVQVGVDLPLFRSQAKAEVGLAQANLDRCVLEEQASRVQVTRDVDDVTMRMDAAITELRRLEQLTTGPVDRLLDSARKALAAGRADQVDVLQAEARSLALRDRLLEKRLELTEIEMELDLAVGL